MQVSSVQLVSQNNNGGHILTNLINELNLNNIPFKADEPMSAHTSFKTGGNASVFIDIPRGCCSQVSVVNTSDQAINV